MNILVRRLMAAKTLQMLLKLLRLLKTLWKPDNEASRIILIRSLVWQKQQVRKGQMGQPTPQPSPQPGTSNLWRNLTKASGLISPKHHNQSDLPLHSFAKEEMIPKSS